MFCRPLTVREEIPYVCGKDSAVAKGAVIVANTNPPQKSCLCNLDAHCLLGERKSIILPLTEFNVGQPALHMYHTRSTNLPSHSQSLTFV